ncbi:MAG: hypothetical protein ACTIDY_05295 [Halomonadaceae bacterium]|nr:hypothetical protein [Halomonas colorata]
MFEINRLAHPRPLIEFAQIARQVRVVFDAANIALEGAIIR